MSVLDKLARSAVRQATRAPRLAKYASEHTSIDEWVLDDFKATAPAFREALERPIELDDGKVYEPSADIHDDIFLAAHAPGETAVKAADQVRPSHQLGRSLLGESIKTDAWREAKPYTEGDGTGSAIFARSYIDEFDKLMRERSMKDAVEQSQQLHEQEQRLEQIMQDLADARDRAKAAHDAGQPIPGEIAQDVKDLTQMREEAAGQLAEAAQDIKAPPGPVVRAAAEQAAGTAKEKAEAWDTVAGLAQGALEDASPDEAWTLAEAWMRLPDYAELCKLIGRMKRDFRAEDARNVIGGDDEIVGIELGNNLTHTLPGELARLGNPLTRRSFMRDYVDEDLLQFETEGHEKVELGPGVMCLDVSGSMGGTKLLNAKACVVGFVTLMHRKNRDAVVICFNGAVVWEHHFKKRAPMDMAALLRLAGLRASGGTNITTAVLKAEQYVVKSPAFKKADVVIVTDGQDPGFTSVVPIRDRFQKAGVRTLGISIGCEPDGPLMAFCDSAISVAQLTEATGDIVRAVS